jgi:SpoVK/Ycf46/Vps4 family AAA+-type ATPase
MTEVASINCYVYGDVNRIMDQVLEHLRIANRSMACKQSIKICHESMLQAFAMLGAIAEIQIVTQDCGLILQTCIMSLKALLNLMKSKASTTSDKNGSINKSRASNNDISFCYTPNICFDDVIGSDDAKMALVENIILPLKLSKQQSEAIFSGIRGISANILLHGPPGIKTGPHFMHAF